MFRGKSYGVYRHTHSIQGYIHSMISIYVRYVPTIQRNAQRHVHRTQSYTHSIVRHAYSIQRYAHCVEYPGMYAHIGFVRNALTIQRQAVTSIMLAA